jgi:hypothetical protein
MVMYTGPLIDQEIQVPAILLLQWLKATATPVERERERELRTASPCRTSDRRVGLRKGLNPSRLQT